MISPASRCPTPAPSSHQEPESTATALPPASRLDRFENVVNHALDNKPWKYVACPILAAAWGPYSVGRSVAEALSSRPEDTSCDSWKNHILPITTGIAVGLATAPVTSLASLIFGSPKLL